MFDRLHTHTHTQHIRTQKPHEFKYLVLYRTMQKTRSVNQTLNYASNVLCTAMLHLPPPLLTCKTRLPNSFYVSQITTPNTDSTWVNILFHSRHKEIQHT